MPADAPTIVATSIGFFGSGRNQWDWVPGPIFEHCFELARASGRRRLCYVGTATGDSLYYQNAVYAAFGGRGVELTHVALFAMPNVEDIRAHLLAQDVIWVGGGSVVNLLAVWRAHGLGEILREAWESGVVLGGVSAGSLCWHVGGTTDSFGPQLRPVTDALGFLPFSNGVHYDSEEQRRPLYHRLVGDGTLPDGYATDDGVGLVYRGLELADVVADRAGPAAYRVTRSAPGEAAEERLEPRLLPGGRA